MFDSFLQGQQVLVLGGTSGLGLATAAGALRAGAQVHVGGRDPQRLAEALAQLGPQASGACVDLADEGSVQAFFAPFHAPLAQVDHLVVCAANNQPARLIDGDLAALRTSLDSRFWGAVHALRAVAPCLAPQGSVLLTSGMVSQRPRPGMAMVAAAASAVESLARSLVGELAPRRINVINPGPMHTPLLERALGGQAQALEGLADLQPLKRLGQAEDFAQTALFAMGNRQLNGAVLHLDGGARWA